jgi:hypothetical protein
MLALPALLCQIPPSLYCTHPFRHTPQQRVVVVVLAAMLVLVLLRQQRR